MDKITTIVWLVLMVAFLVAEATTVQLICIWFAAGSLAALLIGLLGAELWLQILVFFTVSIVLFAMLWPLAKKRFNPKRVATNADALIGKTCLVTEDIDPLEGGRVKVGDVTWSARSENGEVIPVGTEVTVLRIEGVKVFVSCAEVCVK